MFMRIFAMFEIVITKKRYLHEFNVGFHLKGLSLVPSSEGFTITAFLPAYLMYNNCVTHAAKARSPTQKFEK